MLCPDRFMVRTSGGPTASSRKGPGSWIRREDILADFFPAGRDPVRKAEEPSLFARFPEEDQGRARQLYEWLSQSGGQPPELISATFKWPFAVISSLLLRMEIAGLVRQGPGNRYFAL